MLASERYRIQHDDQEDDVLESPRSHEPPEAPAHSLLLLGSLLTQLTTRGIGSDSVECSGDEAWP